MHDRMSTTASEITDDVQVHRGLAGVYIDHTTICEIDNDTHKLRYRGYDITELLPQSAEPMAVLRTAVSVLGCETSQTLPTEDECRQAALGLVAQFPLI